MQVQLVLDNEILNKAVLVSGIKDYNRIAEESIKLYIAFESQKALAKLRGKVEWQSDLEELRRDRNDID